MTQDIWQLDIHALAAAYADGSLSPITVLQACCERIARLDPQINSFVALAPADALAEAAADSAARLARGQPRSPLEGIPLAVKDNLAVAGMPLAWGSHVFGQTPCEADELPIARLRAAGAIFVGKTNTPEFAVEGYTANARFGATGNPWNPALTPGGSSGGSVAAVAAGLVPAAIGTDGGGSIRRPAAYTGLVGLKPGTGRVARDGGLPQVLLDFEVVGPLCRSIRDARLLLATMAGPHPADPASAFLPPLDMPASHEPLRILAVARFGTAPCDPLILDSFAQAVRQIETLGHRVETGPLPFDLAALNAFWSNIAAVGLDRLRRDVPRMATHASPQYLAMADAGAALSATDFWGGLDAVAALRAAAGRSLAQYDVIMMPACAAMPWPASRPFPPEIAGQTVGPRGHAIYTGWVNACGLPGLTLPGAPAPDGMPIGFQLVAGHGRESLLLDLGAAYEARQPWAGRWPTLAAGQEAA